MTKNIKLLKTKIESTKKTLGKLSPDSKQTHISLAIAEDFNGIIDQLVLEVPDIKNIVPKKITSTMPMSHMKKADIKYIDLEIYLDQLIAIISEFESGK
ncbi:hypothetical protein [Rubinisphaera italica]|uniref:Uncharacterized protein n=1 Tax=Rubinisphaera italica TaxID=2527969 RepID=A0A5C5XMS8_9PLAN|nr:hypothetical protein [Rubinisphaera italica]TWT64260.1 hypothetical protein Pan54_50210 [Rubinisphaera italica]